MLPPNPRIWRTASRKLSDTGCISCSQTHSSQHRNKPSRYNKKQPNGIKFQQDLKESTTSITIYFSVRRIFVIQPYFLQIWFTEIAFYGLNPRLREPVHRQTAKYIRFHPSHLLYGNEKNYTQWQCRGADPPT